MRGWYAALVLFLIPAVPSFSTSQRDWENCTGYDLERKIAGCTRIINDRGEDQRNRSRAYNYRANAWRFTGKLDAAVADYDEAIRLNPNYAFPYNGRGLTWRAKGDSNRAIADFNEAIRLNPKYAKTYNNRGEVWRSRGMFDSAIADFDEAIALEPKYALAYFNRGLTWQTEGDLGRSIADLSEAIAVDPKDAFAYLHRGLAWRSKSEIGSAIHDFGKAISLDSKFDIAYLNRGVTNLYAETDAPKVLADFTRASKLDPKNPYFALWTEILRRRMGKPSLLLQILAKIDMTEWPAPILRLFLGQLTPASLLSDARGLVSDGIGNAFCEANFYSAIILLRQRREEDAKKLYQVAADCCPLVSIEWYAATAELKHLNP